VRFRVQGGYLSVGIVAASGAVTTLGEVFDATYPAGQAGLSTRGVAGSFDNVRVSAG
jgi:hypothetical protein